jgi:hypothetical protein
MRRIQYGLPRQGSSFVKKIWDLTWGLVLVVALTAISEIGIRTDYTKTPADRAPAVSQPSTHTVK